nr:hypothetical protein [Trichoderma harzianum]
MASLQDTGGGDGGAGLVLNLAVITTGGLESSNNGHGLLVSDLAEDDVAAVQPRGDDSGDEELRAVAVFRCRVRMLCWPFDDVSRVNLRVGAGVGHGQQTGAVVLQLEVLIGKLLAVDGLAASALGVVSVNERLTIVLEEAAIRYRG